MIDFKNMKDVSVLVSLTIAIISPIVSTVWFAGQLNTRLAVIEERIISIQDREEVYNADTATFRLESQEIRLRIAEIDKRLSIIESTHK